ncbi:MAG: hypothetical protein J0I26_06635 [Alphaproteobacteria bacterium]|nr:hypothetical protein [Alphaproteobacteria bacterium]
MRFSGLLILFLTSVALVGCSLKLQVALFNDAGEAVTVKMEGKSVAIEPGQSGQFDYPGDEQNWMLRLSTATCDYVYQAPKTLEHYPLPSGSDAPLKAQVEGDFSIYLLPPSATAVAAVAGVRSLQQDGFPLHPMSKSCR